MLDLVSDDEINKIYYEFDVTNNKKVIIDDPEIGVLSNGDFIVVW